MNALRTAARILTGSTYAVLGWEAAREPGARVELAASTLATIRKVAPIPSNDTLIVRANGTAQAVGGMLLALGIMPRLSAVALFASLVPTTFAGHSYWTTDEPAIRKQQRIQFQKNAAMLGGLVFAYLDAARD
ncbi:DoxX protein [Nocardia amikacinitolerans]|uniref:DoxX family protein n=1 Tax=Nocardia amikacinitolerans TaxID=756689 RepID=UPI0008352B6C|nr:DoxX family protein [Nocardia amikacinitolerans]MCP2320125.1 DoxX protein [Nocardia amikacinitolerans]